MLIQPSVNGGFDRMTCLPIIGTNYQIDPMDFILDESILNWGNFRRTPASIPNRGRGNLSDLKAPIFDPYDLEEVDIGLIVAPASIKNVSSLIGVDELFPCLGVLLKFGLPSGNLGIDLGFQLCDVRLGLLKIVEACAVIAVPLAPTGIFLLQGDGLGSLLDDGVVCPPPVFALDQADVISVIDFSLL